MRLRVPIARACLHVRTPEWLLLHCSSWLTGVSFRKDDRVIVISTAHGLKFSEFKMGYHRDQLQDWSVSPHYRNEPVVLPPKVDAVKKRRFSIGLKPIDS